jgi:NADPH:quinone reductase-like Zn-dependent oxidoreductase
MNAPMKAARLLSYGDIDSFSIDDIPTPVPADGEILIKIEASAVNPFDLMVRRGDMARFIPLALPAVLGGDAAGVVAGIGDGVTGFSMGDRVIADFVLNGHGAHAAYGVVPATAAALLPDNLSFEQGASLPKAGLMGRQTVEALRVVAGSRVLISGGLGAVGRAAIQYLKELHAMPVAGVRPDRLEEARDLAGEAIDITSVPVEATFEHAISAAAPAALNLMRHVRDGGQVASIVPVPEGANPGSRVRIHELYHRTDAATLSAVARVASLGLLVIPIARVYPLERIGAAHTAVAGGVRGKVVLKH